MADVNAIDANVARTLEIDDVARQVIQEGRFTGARAAHYRHKRALTKKCSRLFKHGKIFAVSSLTINRGQFI